MSQRQKFAHTETCNTITKLDCVPAMQTVPKIVCEPKKLETEGAELEALKVSPVAYVAQMAILVIKNDDNDL